MRRGWWCFGVLLLTACVGDYEGDRYLEVVNWVEIEMVDTPPPGTRVIGVASADGSRHSTATVGTSCRNIDARFIRRMKRAAAFEGGEFLVDVSCHTTEREETSWIHDDPETPETEYCLTCRTSCDAEVARRFLHDGAPE